jgi:cytochrome P450
LAAARQGLDDYFARAVDERRRQRGNDLVSALVSAEESEDRLSQREIVITCDLLLAGNLTTTDLIGNGILALLSHPDQLAKFRARPELVPNAVEEILRYDPARTSCGPVQGRDPAAGVRHSRDDHGHGKRRPQRNPSLSRSR